MSDATISAANRQQIVLRAYVERFRRVFVTRLVSVGALALAVAYAFSPIIAFEYFVCHAGTVALYIWAVEHAARRPRDAGTLPRLKRRSALLSLVVSCPGVALALYVDRVAPNLHVESVVLMMGLVMLMGLQVHLTTLAFAASLLPPIVGLLLVAHTGPADQPYPHFVAGLMFVLMSLACAWRQKQSDQQSAEKAADLADRNADLEAALALAEEKTALAEEASRAKTDLLAVTSHEVRTPLNAVMAMATVLAREASTPRHADLAQSIEAAGGMLLRLLNGVLEFVRMDAGKTALSLAPADTAALVEGVGAVWRSQCEAAGVALRLEAMGEPEALVVEIDAPRVEQTLINLISNAVKLTPAGGEVVVQVHAMRRTGERSSLRFEVADRGPGVAPEDRQRIFEAFEQTAAGREVGGAGLGLAICRRTIALMGGEIGFDARPGGGSVFWFEIEAPIAVRSAAQADVTHEPGALCAQILAADDNPGNREVLKLLLGPMGVELDLVEEGAQAVAAAAARRYDVILMDAKMPVMDGETAVREIRRREATLGLRTPIVMLTANVFPEDVARYLAGGADRVLAKPIDVSALYACLAELMAEDEQEDQSAAA